MYIRKYNVSIIKTRRYVGGPGGNPGKNRYMVVDFRSRSYRLSERVFRYKVPRSQANICILESTM
jgi:hypothetical protein